jgi:hypothetical protein
LCVFIKISCIVYTQTWIQVFLIQVFLNGDLDAKLVSCIPGLRLAIRKQCIGRCVRQSIYCAWRSLIRCKQNVMTTHLNYHNYLGIYTWLSIYISKIKKNIENCEKMYCSFYILVYFSWKTYEGYPYLKTHNFFFYWKYAPNSEC